MKRKPSKKTRDTRVIWVLVYGYRTLRWFASRRQAKLAGKLPDERGPFRVELPMAVARKVCGE